MELSDFITGAAFGAALRASGVYEPAVIRSQFNVTDWHMAETFLAASGTSVCVLPFLGLDPFGSSVPETQLFANIHRVVVALSQSLSLLSQKPRDYSSVGLFASYDGNILGGLLVGAGMVLSGSCPGTIFVQLGAGTPSGFYSFAGCVLGSVVWSGILAPALEARTRTQIKSNIQPKLSVYEQLGISRATATVGIAAMFAITLSTINLLAPPQTRGLVTPIAGGLMIAGSQLISIITRSKLIGASSSFEEAGKYIWWALGGGNSARGSKSYGTMVLTAGMVAGAALVPLVAPIASGSSTFPRPEGVDINPVGAALGGVLLVIGARMGGGCTSGHGISGISLLSVSSFLSVAAMAAGGVLASMFLGL
ncbi:hypothetical protein DL764_000100 [Monosporascus ibericus]|uniref:Uncharacterized protein n=1 Tax=Monosporascus ibericus TaxID=155417 RepID=A0A4Q4TV80_9PEZI|nr:hypothetical protein DL764_000100 [Monosporascus ibericus]